MNAPATNLPHRRDIYAPAVDALLPGCDDREKLLRCSMMLMRDNAQRVQGNACQEAFEVLQVTSRIAAEHCLSSLSPDKLEDLRFALVRLVAVASSLETIFGGGRDAHD